MLAITAHFPNFSLYFCTFLFLLFASSIYSINEHLQLPFEFFQQYVRGLSADKQPFPVV